MTSDERCGWDRPPLQEKEIFKFNAQQYPEEKFYTYVGLARGYTAIGDKEDAIKNWEIALRTVPEVQKPNLPTYQRRSAT